MSDYGLNSLTGDYLGRRIKNLANAVYLRLSVPLGSWWAVPGLGSRLHELRREKDVPRIKTLARQYAAFALQSLIDDGRAEKINITAAQPHNGTCLLHVEVYAPEGKQVYSYPVKVS